MPVWSLRRILVVVAETIFLEGLPILLKSDAIHTCTRKDSASDVQCSSSPILPPFAVYFTLSGIQMSDRATRRGVTTKSWAETE